MFRMGITLSYRYSPNFSLQGISAGELNQFNAKLSFRLGEILIISRERMMVKVNQGLYEVPQLQGYRLPDPLSVPRIRYLSDIRHLTSDFRCRILACTSPSGSQL